MRLSPVPSAVAFSCRHPVLVALAAVLLCGLSAWYVSGHFRMSTKTEELVAEDVNYRVRNLEMDEAFPQVADVILVVVDAKTPELAEAAAAQLTEKLKGNTIDVRGVRRPDGGEFFSRAALLYGSVEDVQKAKAFVEDLGSLEMAMAALVAFGQFGGGQARAGTRERVIEGDRAVPERKAKPKPSDEEPAAES